MRHEDALAGFIRKEKRERRLRLNLFEEEGDNNNDNSISGVGVGSGKTGGSGKGLVRVKSSVTKKKNLKQSSFFSAFSSCIQSLKRGSVRIFPGLEVRK